MTESLSPLEGAVPVAWAVFASKGNVRLWSTDSAAVREFAASIGELITPLYAAPSHPPASAVMGEVRVLTEDEVAHLWDTYVGDPTEKYPLDHADVQHFASAVQLKWKQVNAGKTIPAANEGGKK